MRDMVHQFIEELKKEAMVKKNLYEHTWLSGSSTEVYPIEIHKSSWHPEIVLQWKSNRRCDSFIRKMTDKYNDIVLMGAFWKSDGSCPSTITFYLKEKISS